MSASLLVDLGNTCQIANTINNNVFGTSLTSWTSGLQTPLSGAICGNSVDMLNANTFCNLLVTGIPAVTSGQLRVAVQCSDVDTSGLYTDPTSGLPQFPTSFQSGGILWINSGGLTNGTFGAAVSGQQINSGFAVAAGFQRPQRYVRALVVAGDSFIGDLDVNFISNLKTTGSGGGFSWAPQSGTTVNV